MTITPSQVAETPTQHDGLPDMECYRDPDCWLFQLARADGTGTVVKVYEGPIFDALDRMFRGMAK